MSNDSDVSLPFYADLRGNPLQGGSVYFGTGGANPVTSPVTVYWDEAGTQPAAQPITISNGLTTRNGAPARVYVPASYSRLVLDSSGRQVAYEATSPSSLRSALAASGGSALVGFIGSGASDVARTAQDKLREWVTFEDSGTTGTADDTTVMQRALNKSSLYIRGTPGKTYTVDGTLASSLANRVLDFTGCAVNLKASAATKICLTISGSGTQVIGGTFDGTKASGNSGTTINQKYAAGCIWLQAVDDVQIRHVALNNSYGAGINGNGGINRLLIDSCTSSGCELYGAYISSSAAADQTGNRAINNIFDMTGNTTPAISGATGILFNSLYSDATDSGFAQTNWSMRNNRITLLPSVVSGGVTSCSGISGRGYTGEYIANYVSGGSLGITEGSRGTRYIDNYCDSQYYAGIEPHGNEAFVSNNVILNSTLHGISFASSAGLVQRNLTIKNNLIKNCALNGIYVNPASGGTMSNMLIQGNSIYCGNGGSQRAMTISDRKCLGAAIIGNNMFGIASGRAIVFENTTTDSNAFVSGNTFEDFLYPLTIYHAAPTVVNDFVATENTMKACGSPGGNAWAPSTANTTFGLDVIYRRNSYNQGVLSGFEPITLRGAPVAYTTSATLNSAHILAGIIQGTHAAGATQTYTLPDGPVIDSVITMNNQVGGGFKWSLINLSAGAANTITLGAGAAHTVIGNSVVDAGTSGRWLTKKTAAATYVTYRLA